MKSNGVLSGLSVVITGAASGIGRQLARELFWEERCRLILLDRDFQGLEVLKDEFGPTLPPDPSVDVYSCDISSQASAEKFLSALGEKPVDILVNNAGMTHVGLFEKMKPEDIETLLGANLLGAMRMTRMLLPKLLESRGGRIVNVNSMAGLIPAPGLSAYTASKFGMIGFSKALAQELDGRVGISVVCPAFVKTGIADNALLGGELARPEREHRTQMMNTVLSLAGSNPKRTCRAIIRAIKTKKSLVLVNPDAYLLYYFNKFLPSLTRALIAKVYEKIKAMGLLE